MARSNLKTQFWRAIIGCCRFGESKHARKIKTNESSSGFLVTNPWIHSDEYKDDLKAFTLQMANFVKENYPATKYLTRIKSYHWNHFLETKVSTCSTKTLNLYHSYICKLELSAEQFMNLKHPLKWSEKLIRPESLKTPIGELLRVQQMSVKDFNKVMAYTQQKKARWSKASIAFELSRRFGLRVAECADICVNNVFLNEPGKWDNGYITIIGKGKRFRKIDIRTTDDRAYIVNAIDGLDPDDKIVGIDKGSINKELWRIMTFLKIKQKYPVTGIHSIRKLYSQETFRWVQKEKKMKEAEAMRYVNAQLGHSEERDSDLLAVYVKDVKKKKEREKKKRDNSAQEK